MYLDVSDVHAARRIGRYPELWELHEEHKEDVIKRLEQTYGATDDKKLFEERLMEIAERIAADYYEEFLPDLQYMIEDSFLEGLDEQNVGIRLRDTLSESISFTLLSACGVDMQEYGSEFAFDFIHEFNSMDTLAVLGDAANELAKPVLLEIGRTIRAYNRSHEQEQTENLTQKGLANTSEIDYNALKRESESGHEEYIDNNQNSVERGNSDESDIRKERGLSDSDITGGHSAGGNRNEVRMMRETYLKENHRGVYSAFLLKGTLKEHLLTIQKQAEERMEKLTSQMAATEGVTEQLKETDQMLWVAKMNNIRNRAEEVVLGELVYSL